MSPWTIGGWIILWIAFSFLTVTAFVLACQTYRRWHARRQQRQQRLRDHIKAAGSLPVRDGLAAITEQLWTDGCPRCIVTWDSRADRCGLIPCAAHTPPGRHHATAPEYGPEPVVAKPYDEWAEQMEQRYAE